MVFEPTDTARLDSNLQPKDRPSTLYRSSVALSAILVAAGRHLSVKAGHAAADYEYIDPNVTFAALASSPRVRLRSITNTQGLPSYRLTILPSQNASVHVPEDQFITLGATT